MYYKQNVIIKNKDINSIKSAFHSIDIIIFLTKYQPIKIIHWDGIKNNDTASLKFWFFKWHIITVKHNHYKNINNLLRFVDEGVTLPLGITNWSHEHKIIKTGDNVTISDILIFNHNNYILGLILYPILIFPIFIRRVLYKFYF